MNIALQQMVRQTSLFKNISPEIFSRVIAAGLPRSVEEDGFFFIQGDAATHAYVLTKGQVKLLQVSPNGNQITLRIITPGQTYGAIALLNPKTGYPVTAQAVTDSAALAWESTKLRLLVENDSTISFNLISLMHGYIGELQAREHELLSDRVEQRIARNLLKLAAQAGIKIDSGLLINLPITRQEIAEMSGTTVFTVSRTLNMWHRDGILDIGREKVVICDPHRLVIIADDLVDRG